MNLPREIFYQIGIAHLYAAGETIYYEGEAAHEMYLIIEGSVDEYRAGRLAHTFGAGQMLDEVALLRAGSRTTTAIAREGAILVPIDAQRFEHIVRTMPLFALIVIRSLAEQLGSPGALEPLLERSIAA